MAIRQPDMFAELARFPAGFLYAEEFLTAAAEAKLVATIRRLPFKNARYKEWTANRRIVSYGGRYDFNRNELLPEEPIPPCLEELRSSAAAFAAVPREELTHALVAEYAPGTQLGWHRDVPDFEVVVGVSLLGSARLRLRRYPHTRSARERPLVVELAPRSVYTLRDEARWSWQHAIAPTRELRYSITFRSLRRAPAEPRL